MGYLLQFYAVCLLSLLAKALPIEASTWVARQIGTLSYFILKKKRKIALENLEKAFGNSLTQARKEQITRLAFQNVSLSLMELFIVEKIKKEAGKRFGLSGNEFLEEVFSKGRGVILVISHLGSWEYLSFLPYFTKRPWSVVVKEIKNPHLDKAIDTLRRIMTVVPINKMSSIKAVLRELKKGHGVAILIDQWAGDEGIWADFFNIGTSTTSIPARLAKSTGAALIPAYCLRKNAGHYAIHIEKPIDWDPDAPDWESSATQKLNWVLERQIREHPEQWLWGHRRWKDKPDSIRVAA